MEAFLKKAVVGTARYTSPLPATETALDALITQLPAEQEERSLLLAAGAYAIYSQAGFVAPEAPAALPQAEPEILPVCSAAIAHQFESLLSGHANVLLPEALQCLQAAQLRLPHALLAQSIAYATANPKLREAFIPILGTRGHWLSQFNPKWRWMGQQKIEDMAVAEQETLWQEGTIRQRKQTLQHIRATDPAKARDWLQSVWKQEKAEIREDLLHTFAINVSHADHAFLEQALNDGSHHVRAIAVKLLSYLPESSQMQRILLCADSIFNYKNNEMEITLPTPQDRPWKELGNLAADLTEKSSPQEWLHYILRLTPPSHWEEHLSLSPMQIIEHVANHELINDLIFAAQWHRSLNWYEPLLRWSITYSFLKTRQQGLISTYCQRMLAALPQEQAETLLMPLVEHPDYWEQAVMLLPGPWSKKYSQHFIQMLQKYYARENNTNYTAWTNSVATVACALHPSCFELAQGPWERPETDVWYTERREQQVKLMLALIDMRQQFLKEIN